MKTSQLIFYLDDDNDDLEFFKDIAESLGHKVSIFSNGNEMLYTLKHQMEKPDIIFLDIHMPILNGEEILNIIKKSDKHKHIPIIMVSGAYPKKLVRYYMDAGVNYLMKKPGINEYKLALEQVLSIDFQNLKSVS